MVAIIPITNLGHDNDKFVWRTPETANYDLAKGDLIDDVNYNAIDLSAIVPSDATHVYIKVLMQDGAAGSQVSLRATGQTSINQTLFMHTQVANIHIALYGIVALSASKTIELAANPKPTDWTTLNTIVLGWSV